VGPVVPKPRILISVTEARECMGLNPHTAVDKTGQKMGATAVGRGFFSTETGMMEKITMHGR